MNRDEQFMQEALAEAAKGVGLTRPNPPVGAVVVKQGKVIGRGFHPRAGEPHAEVFALRDAGAKARGADLYVTLEPCSTTGRTPPCVQAILQAGIRRVVVGAVDPNPKHAGRGLELLRQLGVEVESGVCSDAAAALIEPFARWVTSGLPHVTLKLGMTLDGRIADARGHSQWITGEAARDRVQALRRGADAILVGNGTLRADNPSLLPRPDEGRHPFRLVLDPFGRVPATLKVFTDGHEDQTLLFTSRHAAKAVRAAQAKSGCEMIELTGPTPDDFLAQMFALCGRRGLLHVLCEGGGQLAGSLLRQGLAHEGWFFVNPSLLGAEAAPAFSFGPVALEHRPRFDLTAVEQVGGDLLLRARFSAGPMAVLRKGKSSPPPAAETPEPLPAPKAGGKGKGKAKGKAEAVPPPPAFRNMGEFFDY